MSVPVSAPGSRPAGRPCQTRVHYSTMPTDLRTWAEASAELAVTPHPMSERHLRELFKQRSRRRTWRLPGQRAEYVSLDDVLEFQRDLRNGWLTSNS